MAVQWPEVGNITLQSVILLREGLVHVNIFLEYRLLLAFLAEGYYRLQDATSSENIKALVKFNKKLKELCGDTVIEGELYDF